jgi:hypothetical protein
MGGQSAPIKDDIIFRPFNTPHSSPSYFQLGYQCGEKGTVAFFSKGLTQDYNQILFNPQVVFEEYFQMSISKTHVGWHNSTELFFLCHSRKTPINF